MSEDLGTAGAQTVSSAQNGVFYIQQLQISVYFLQNNKLNESVPLSKEPLRLFSVCVCVSVFTLMYFPLQMPLPEARAHSLNLNSYYLLSWMFIEVTRMSVFLEGTSA